MKEIVSDAKQVAYCGLYCGACGRYLKGKCLGCHGNDKATWCKIRSCCIEHKYASCADCKEFEDPKDCKKFDNFMATLFGLIFRSDRRACILKIKEIGPVKYADMMTEQKRQSIRR